jgi:hypothetical protein
MFLREVFQFIRKKIGKNRFSTKGNFVPEVFPVVPENREEFREENPNFGQLDVTYTLRPQNYGIKVYAGSRPRVYVGWIRNDVWRECVPDGRPSNAMVRRMLAICKADPRGRRREGDSTRLER